MSDALGPLVDLVVERVLERLGERAVAPTRPWSQVDGERPPGCGRARYLRVWRRARDAGDPGATADGRARILTRDAYERHAATSRPRPALRLVAADVLDALDAS